MSKLKYGLVITAVFLLVGCQSKAGEVHLLAEETPKVTIQASPSPVKEEVKIPEVTMEQQDYQKALVESYLKEPRIYNIPLSEALQRYTYKTCEDYGIQDHYGLVLAIMWQESHYVPNLVSPSNDWGLMQINKCNHYSLSKLLGITDFLDPEQNILGGVYIISTYLVKYDYNKSLMCYNQGDASAQHSWAAGAYSSTYSREVLAKLELLKQNKYI